jgi:hypothetical protein
MKIWWSGGQAPYMVNLGTRCLAPGGKAPDILHIVYKAIGEAGVITNADRDGGADIDSNSNPEWLRLGD